MTELISIYKYSMDATAGVVGQQPYKTKAKFNQLVGWKYTDKLNQLTLFQFTVPNDEFGRANAVLERKTFVPFLKPFRGIVCVKSQDETQISVESCEFAFHLTRKIFRQNSNARVIYGAPLVHLQFEEDILDSSFSNDGTFTIDEETDTNGFNNTNQTFATGSMYVGKLSGLPPNALISDLTIDVSTAAGNIRIKAFDSVDEIPTNLLGEGNSTTVGGTGNQKFPFISTFTVPANGEIWVGFENDSASLDLSTTASLGAGVQTKSVTHTFAPGPATFGTPTDETYGMFLKVHYKRNLNTFFSSGRIGKGIEFNGKSRVNIANETTFDFDRTDKFTISVWWRGEGTDVETLVAKRSDFIAASPGYILSLQSTGIPQFQFSDGTTEFTVDATTNIRDNRYHHIVCTFNGGSNQSGMLIYVDNILEGTGTSVAMTGSMLNALTVSLGAGNIGDSKAIGVMDDAKIYDRVLTPSAVAEIFLTRQNPPEASERKTAVAANVIAQDILTAANLDMPSGVSWTISDGFPTTEVVMEYNFENHYEALQDIAKVLGKDLFFNNQTYKVFIETKGKTVSADEGLDVTITSSPEISTDNFANDINLLGKSLGGGEQLEDRVTTSTVLRFNYERVVSDNKLNTKDQLRGIGNALLSEFQRLTPLIKGTIPFNQFVRLALASGDIIPISQPEKQLNGNFRVMDLTVSQKIVKISLEKTDTAVIRLRSLSLTDVIGGILKRLETQAIET